MARQRWKTFGYDMARANAHIGRQTGKWGRLKDPDEVWDYIEREMPGGQGNLLNQPAATASQEPPEPPKPRCGMKTARIIVIGQGKAQICHTDDYGKPTTMIDEKPAEGSGRAWKCENCGQRFQEWAQFIDHCLAQPKP